METVEVLPPTGIDNNTLGYKQPDVDWTFIDGDGLFTTNDLAGFAATTSSMNMSADLASVLLSDAGTTLSEMLQTESVLQLTDNYSPCSLTKLLTSDSTIQVLEGCNNNTSKIPNIPDSMMIAGEPFNNGKVPPASSGQGVSEHTLSTAGTLVQILQRGSSVVKPAVTQLTTPIRSQHSLLRPSLTLIAQVTKSEQPSSATSMFNQLTGQGSRNYLTPDAAAIALAEDNGLFPNLEDHTLALLNGDESNISFENGIEATDMCSLLEQFEAVDPFPSDDLHSLDSMDISADVQINIDNNILGQDEPEIICQGQSDLVLGQGDLVLGQGDLVLNQPEFICQSGLALSQGELTQSDIALDQLLQGVDQSQVEQGQGQLVSPDSEVVKLLKAPPVRGHAIVQQTVPVSPRNTNPQKTGTTVDPPKIPHKAKIGLKRKAVLMQCDSIPCEQSNKSSSSTSTDINKDSAVLKLLQGSNSSGRNSPVEGVSASDVPARELKKVSLLEYRQRLKQRLAGMTDESMESRVSKAEVTQDGNNKVNKSYFDKIGDHDYCQNVPVKVEANEETKKDIQQGMTAAKKAKPGDPNNTLKGLLLNKNLSEELKEQAVKDRAETQRNMNTTGISVEMSNPEQHTEFRPSNHRSQTQSDSHSRKRNYRKRDNSVERMVRERDRAERGRLHLQRQRLERERAEREKLEREKAEGPPIIDKLPSYCTTLAVQPIPGMVIKKTSSSSKIIDTALPSHDRDPSPDRSAPVFNKVPAYFSCFTNSTRYDKIDPVPVNANTTSGQYPWDKIRSNNSSATTSRSQSPAFIIDDRSSRHSSRSSSGSRSRSPRRSWQTRRHRGSLSSRSRSRSLSSSCSSTSRCRSRSRSHSRSYNSPSRSRSKLSYRSRSRSYRSRSRSHSSHRSRRHKSRYSSRSRRKSRSSSCDRYRRRSRCNSQERYWQEYREEMKVKRENEKKQQIAERRIMYIGRIAADTTRRELRQTFEQFGDIEEVSVHFRERGDNYGFVTYVYTCDAYAAIERGNALRGCEHYDLCFGGRRQFCRTDYADLDGNKEEEEEMGPVCSNSSKDLDFDTLLKQATKKLKKH